MGKGELWDDSALINAFDDAMSEYKKMHGKKTTHSSSGEEQVSASVAHESHTIRDAEDNSNVTSNTSTDFGETKNLSSVQEDHYLDSVDPKPHVDSSSGQHEQGVNDYAYLQNVEGYNQLLTQYYELEEKRQGILQQLQQYGDYNYQPSAEGFGSSQQLGTFCNSQCHLSCTALVGSCCPYACHCSAASTTSCPSCPLCQTSSCKMCDNSSSLDFHEKSGPLLEGDIVKTAMGAAEKAISSVKAIASTSSCTQEKEKAKHNAQDIAQSMTSETDLTVVLNAWYSAGFYTGKYLTEQSVMKKPK